MFKAIGMMFKVVEVNADSLLTLSNVGNLYTKQFAVDAEAELAKKVAAAQLAKTPSKE